MASTASPYGLLPLNLIGGQSFTGGSIRDYVMTTNSATAIFKGDIVQLGASTAGQPTAMTTTPTTSTQGLVGVAVGVSYVDPVLKYQVFANFLPANAISAGYTNVAIRVVEDPDQLYQVQADGSVGLGAIGKNAELTNFGGSTTTGNSTIALESTTPANTSTFAVRIVDLVNGPFSTPGDAKTDCIVKFNFGVHSYYQSVGTVA
jgi:hypothetical protein